MDTEELQLVCKEGDDGKWTVWTIIIIIKQNYKYLWKKYITKLLMLKKAAYKKRSDAASSGNCYKMYLKTGEDNVLMSHCLPKIAVEHR